MRKALLVDLFKISASVGGRQTEGKKSFRGRAFLRVLSVSAVRSFLQDPQKQTEERTLLASPPKNPFRRATVRVAHTLSYGSGADRFGRCSSPCWLEQRSAESELRGEPSRTQIIGRLLALGLLCRLLGGLLRHSIHPFPLLCCFGSLSRSLRIRDAHQKAASPCEVVPTVKASV